MCDIRGIGPDSFDFETVSSNGAVAQVESDAQLFRFDIHRPELAFFQDRHIGLFRQNGRVREICPSRNPSARHTAGAFRPPWQTGCRAGCRCCHRRACRHSHGFPPAAMRACGRNHDSLLATSRPPAASCRRIRRVWPATSSGPSACGLQTADKFLFELTRCFCSHIYLHAPRIRPITAK